MATWQNSEIGETHLYHLETILRDLMDPSDDESNLFFCLPRCRFQYVQPGTNESRLFTGTATCSDKNKALVNGYIRELYSTNTVPKEINDLIFLFFFIMIGSEMLTNEEEDRLMEWIDDSKKCHFELLFKATRDGFESAEFHKKCDGKGANVSIIKSDNECIFGGCVSKSWHSQDEDIYDDYAWLYSLRNNKGIRKKFKIVKQQNEAMYGGNTYGPMYGNGDLFISNDCNYNEGSFTELGEYYEGGSDPHQLNDGKGYFKVLDYEIWQIITK